MCLACALYAFAIYVFLYQNLNEKYKNMSKEEIIIYVFLYQNLNRYIKDFVEIKIRFMYFYIRI